MFLRYIREFMIHLIIFVLIIPVSLVAIFCAIKEIFTVVPDKLYVILDENL